MSFFAGAIVGGAIGAITALLMAPRTGAETRALVKRKAGELSKEFDGFKEDLGPKFQKIKKQITQKFATK